MIQAKTRLARPSKGFSLIELMVALALGLIMIGAVVTVFLSNQQTARTKQEVDRAQEAFRFASYTIMRVVQQGRIQTPTPPTPPTVAQDLLVVIVLPGLGRRDCFGNAIGADIIETRNTFFIDSGRLQCRVVNVRANAANNTTEVETLVIGVDGSRSQAIIDGNARSVRVLLAMQSEVGAIGPSARFSATMRCDAPGIC